MDGSGRIPWQGTGTYIPAKLPTVEDALPYTPLSSIVPFSPDVISFPSAVPSTNNSVFTSAQERQENQQYLAALDQEVKTQGKTSLRLQQTLGDLQRLLNPDHMPTFVFKSPSPRPSHPASANAMAANGVTSTPVQPKLGSFARIALNNTNVAYKYKDAPSSAVKVKNSDNFNQSIQGAQRTTQADRPPPPPAYQQIHNGNYQMAEKHTPHGSPPIKHTSQNPPARESRIPMSSPGHPTTPSVPSRKGPMVVIPVKRASVTSTNTKQIISPAPNTATPIVNAPFASNPRISGPAVVISALSSSQRSEYESYPELDAQIQTQDSTFSRKRNVENTDTGDGAVTLNRDQILLSQAAVQKLNTFLLDAFEADDAGEQGTMGTNPSDSVPIFTTISIDGSDVRTFTQETLDLLQTLIQKVITAKQFRSIPGESLRRVQKLCEGGVLSVAETTVTISGAWSDSDVEEWVSRLTDTADGLQAAKLVLKIMTAAGNDRRLCPEELIQSMISAVKHVLDTCLIRVVESRDSGSDDEIFKIAAREKGLLNALLTRSGNILKLLGQVLMNISVTEEARSSIEDLAVRLIFVENATTEKDSVLGIQKFENVRRKAMDVVASIFNCYAEQRDSIIQSILASLSSLPVTRQNARQFRTSEGKAIQMVSALLMRLVQSSATRTARSSSIDGDDDNNKIGGAISATDDESSDSDSSTNSTRKAAGDRGKRMSKQVNVGNQSLKSIAKPLSDAATNNAHLIASYMVQRAIDATKGGESPYLKLLEIFAEDLVVVLVADSLDWPAAEMLLRRLSICLGLVYDDKNSSVASKNMALDLMGLMTGGLSDLQKYVRQSSRALDTGESPLDASLVQISDLVLGNDIRKAELYAFEGPYRICLQHLQSRAVTDLHLQSACGYLLARWAFGVISAQKVQETENEFDDIADKLKHMIINPHWLQHNYEFASVSSSQARLASAVAMLQTQFGESMPVLLNKITNATGSTSALTKSRGLKVLMQLSEKDSSLLKQSPNVIAYIRNMAWRDSSAMTRDSALQLLQKSCYHDRELEKDIYRELLRFGVNDLGPNPKKRSMRLLKEIYLRNEDAVIRSEIAATLLVKLQDVEDSAIDLAKQSLEELWVTPFRGTRDARANVTFKANVSLIVTALKHDTAVIKAFEIWINGLLGDKARSSSENNAVFKDLVTNLFEKFVDDVEIEEQKSILRAVAIFAKANPRLLTRPQLNQLTPFLKNLTNTDELEIFISSVEILTYTIPSLTSPQDLLLAEVEKLLLESLSKLTKSAVYQAALCFNVLSGLLETTGTKCSNMAKSILRNMRAQKTGPPSKVKKWIILLGAFGNACDFAPYIESFRNVFKEWKGTTVLSLFVDEICPHTAETTDAEVREAAFQAIGLISLKRPKELNRPDVLEAMETVFKDTSNGLDSTALEVLRDFFVSEEKRSETGAVIAVGQGAVHGAERMGTSLNASENDGVSTTLAQTFLKPVKRIAMAAVDKRAVMATETLVSVSRQGLVHPNDCIPTLVALGTSDQEDIAQAAFKEHESVHNKYESIVAKKYHESVYQSFKYQRDLVQNSRGARLQPFSAKLKNVFTIMKNASTKVRKDFLKNFVAKLQFDLDSLDTTGDKPEVLYFARYVLENIAACEYVRTDELLVLTDNLLKIFSNAGTVVAEAIENEILQPHSLIQAHANSIVAPVALPEEVSGIPDMPSVIMSNGDSTATVPGPPPPEIDPERLRHITVASMILSLVLETRNFLRRYYALEKVKDKKEQFGKVPAKVFSVMPDKYWQQSEQIMGSLLSPESMLAQCQTFATAVTHDTEHKVGSDDEDSDAALIKEAAGYETPEEQEEAGSDGKARTPGSARGKKRKSSSFGAGSNGVPTPKKRKGRPAGSLNKKTLQSMGRRASSASLKGDD